MRRSRVAKIVLLVLVIGPLAILAFGGLVMLLWNNALAPALNIPLISFWQGLGILVLSKILFSSFNGGRKSRGGYTKQRMMWNSMNPEQKEKFKEEWNRRCGKWGYKSQDTETSL